MNHLVFRRQFLLTTKNVEVDATWNKSILGKYHRACYLHWHPDLEYTFVINGEFELHLLGYILDPHHPGLLNKDILENLSRCGSFEAIANATNTLTGRFVILYNSTDKVNALHDATGFRQLFHFNDGHHFACGSTPDIIARYLSVERDNEKLINEFYNSHAFRAQRFWFGTRTVFKGIEKLLPNHYLDVVKNKVYRFWPTEERKFNDLSKAAKNAGDILTSTFESALNRYQVQQSITSGWDTRLLLAASKKHYRNVEFYFIRGNRINKGAPGNVDYNITKSMAEKLNLTIRYHDDDMLEVDKEFERIYYANNVLAHPKLLKTFYFSYLNKLDNYFTVSGTEGNVLYRIKSDLNRNMDKGIEFAHKFKYSDFPYIIDTVEEWLGQAKYLRDMNYNLLDMFYWEQGLGNLGAQTASEQDIIREELRPLNNRELVSNLAFVEDRFRYKDYPLNYVKTIKYLWPELLNFDNDIVRSGIKKALRVINLERFADRMYQKIKA